MSGSASRRKRKSGFLRHRRPALNTMFALESIALIGATEAPGSFGRVLLENLTSYPGPVYPVNLRRHTVLGLPAFPKIGAVPGRVDLAIIEAKEILASYGIPMVETRLPKNEEEAVELILGKRIDPNFGPIILFGAGGRLAEVWSDRAIGLPLLNVTHAKRLMERTRIYAALRGV